MTVDECTCECTCDNGNGGSGSGGSDRRRLSGSNKKVRNKDCCKADDCDGPLACPTTIPGVSNQRYILANDRMYFNYSPDSELADDCLMNYTYTVDQPVINDALNWNSNTLTWDVYDENNLLLAGEGDSGRVYNIVVTGTNPKTGVALTTEFTLTIINPCLDADLVKFPSDVMMPEYTMYYLYEAKPENGIDLSSLTLLETEPPLCMQGLTYLITFDNELVTETSEPLNLVSFDQLSAAIFKLYTEADPELGQHELYVTAQLANMPARRLLEARMEERREERRL